MLILGKSSTQGLGGHSLTAEKLYSVNFTVTRKKFCLSWHCNGTNSYLFLNGTENISKDWSVDNMKSMFMILVLIMLLLFMIFYTFKSI